MTVEVANRLKTDSLKDLSGFYCFLFFSGTVSTVLDYQVYTLLKLFRMVSGLFNPEGTDLDPTEQTSG